MSSGYLTILGCVSDKYKVIEFQEIRQTEIHGRCSFLEVGQNHVENYIIIAQHILV